MSSMTERIIAAHQAGLSERRAEEDQAHQREIRQFQIKQLKHEQDRLKLHDLAENLGIGQAMHQMQMQMPGEAGGTATTDAPVIQPGDMTPAAKDVQAPTSLAPALQAIMNRPAPMQPMPIQGIPESVAGPTAPYPDINIGEGESAVHIPGTNQEQTIAAQWVADARKRRLDLEQKILDPQKLGPGDVLYAGGRKIAENPKAAPEPSGELREFIEIGLPALAAKLGKPVSQVTSQEGLTGFTEFVQSKQARKLLTPEEEAQQVRIAGSKAAATAAERPSKPPTQNESESFRAYQRIANAEAVIKSLEASIQGSSKIRLNYAPNFMQSDGGQRFNQASADFVNAALRRESGAAISQSEYERFNKLYFPQPGDAELTLKQKAKAREVIIQGLKIASGKAFSESFSEPDGSGGKPGTAAEYLQQLGHQ